MNRAWLSGSPILMCMLAVSALNIAAAPAAQPQPARPTRRRDRPPAEDCVGFPDGYQTDYQTFFVMDCPDNRQVRVIYANDKATSAKPGDFLYGSIRVIETYRAQEDEDGNPVLDDTGRLQRDACMRRLQSLLGGVHLPDQP